MNYKNLNRAISAFMEDMWLPYEDSLNCINNDIQNGTINEEELKKEFQLAINNRDLDWINFANRTQLLSNPQDYLNIEIKNYVKGLLCNYLFPEKCMKEDYITALSNSILTILREYRDNDGWMLSYDLYDKLIEKECFKDLEYYNLNYIPYSELNIELKLIDTKEREIGFLRHKLK